MFVQRGNVWLSLGQERDRLREELAALELVDIPTVGESLVEAEAELKIQEVRLREIETATEDAHRLLAVEQASLQAAQARTAALEEDLAKYREIAKLRRLGSEMDGRDLLGDECPTCHQSVPDSLTLGNAPGSVFMSVEENIRLLDSQLKMFALLAQDAEAKVALQEQQIEQGRLNASACRSAIRWLRRTLTADERAPSEAAIARRLALEDRIVRIEALERRVAESIVEFGSLAKRWAQAEAELESLPRGLVSELDQRKVESLERSFVSQAATYGVTSVRPSGLSIARDSYRPTYEGFDLKFDLSASDGIRVTWAYLNAFMEVAREFRTNHPGLLIFDDPRQQNAKPESLAELFGRVAVCGKFAQQMIVATSEKEDSLLAMLQDLPHTLHRLDGRSLQRLPKK